MSESIFIEGLNPQQARAVQADAGPILVLAGPGSGKTRVLTRRVAFLIGEVGVPAYNILASTFTNKAADEMRERVETMGLNTRGILLGTFHAICARILRQEAEHLPHYDRNFTIYDVNEQQAVVRGLLDFLGKDPKRHSVRGILALISQAKNDLVSPEHFHATNYQEEIASKVYPYYREHLINANAMDFDDLLMEAALLFRQDPTVLEKYRQQYRYLMIDEFQDTNLAQYQIVRALGFEHRNLFVVGDPDQSIYAFRGADYRNIKRFKEDFPEHETITLDENYRSHQAILDAAMTIIQKDPTHIKRELFSQRKKGPKPEIHETRNARAEATFIAHKIALLRRDEGYGPRDFAVMYRTNAQSRLLEQAFIDQNMPYQIFGGLRFYERMEIKDLLAYLHVVNNPQDDMRLLRIINTPVRGIGGQTLEFLKSWAADQGSSLWSGLLALDEGRLVAPNRAKKPLLAFKTLVEAWQEQAARNPHQHELLLQTILKDTQYLTHIASKSNDDEYIARTENIYELLRDLSESNHLTLTDYLNQKALMTEPRPQNEALEAVQLMTLHGAKGLEFSVVFMPGVEEGLLPHSRSKDNPQEMSEERRLMYVGITRAKERLYLSFCQNRDDDFGFSMTTSGPSSFLADLPPDVFSFHSPWRSVLPGHEKRYTPPSPRSPNAETSPSKQAMGRQWESPPKASPATDFAPGDMVRHQKFGIGMVQGSVRSADIEEVEVQFSMGIKRIDAQYLVKEKVRR